MKMRNLAEMNTSELVEESRRIRETLDSNALRLLEASRLLYARNRRELDGERLPGVVLYANMLTRFSGLVVQSMRRLRSFERLVSGTTPESAAEAIPDSNARSRRQGEPKHKLPVNDPLAELLGEDVVNAIR